MRTSSWGTALLAAGALMVGGCERRKVEQAAPGSASAPVVVDLGPDREAAQTSWLVGLAKDPTPLVTLAESSAGWRHLFGGDPAQALEAFEQDLSGGQRSVQIGAARSALALAEAHVALQGLTAEITPRLSRAQAARPDSEALAPWRGWVMARAAAVRDEQVSWPKSPATKPYVDALSDGAAGPLAGLFRGEAAGLEAELPASSTAAHRTRLRLRILVATGKLKAARRQLQRLRADAPDITVGTESFMDPGAAGAGAQVFAAIALASLGDASGWTGLLKARALVLLGQRKAAAELLGSLLSAPPKTADFAQYVLTGALSAADLRVEAQARRAVLLGALGDATAGRALAASIPTARVAERTWRAWALASLGQPIDTHGFPADRGVITQLLTTLISGLGDVPGAQDVADLMLVDRYVDQLQRRFALALRLASQPTLAVKAREAAEDKGNAFAPSPRNALAALVQAAQDNVGIGRPRVALKYLTRLRKRLPEADGPGEMLRDLLSLRAMDQAGGATAGQ